MSDELTAAQKKGVVDAAITLMAIAYTGGDDAGELMRITLRLVFVEHQVTFKDVIDEVEVRLKDMSPEASARIANGLQAMKP